MAPKPTYQELIQRVDLLEQENCRLKSEIEQLRSLAGLQSQNNNFTASQVAAPQALTIHLSLEEKVELFRSIFRGREDVFARRWQSNKSGKSG